MNNKPKKKTFKTGVNLQDGRRFEAGDAVPSDLTEKELKALKDAIEE